MTVGAIMIFTAGELVRCRGAFTNRDLTDYELGVFQEKGTLPAGVGVDPPSVSCTAKRPDGSEVSIVAQRFDAGSYYADVDTTGFKGTWWVKLASPSGQVNQGAAEGHFQTTMNV